MFSLGISANASVVEETVANGLAEQLTPKVEAILERLIELSSLQYRGMTTSERREAHQQFHLLLDGLGQQIGDSPSIEVGESAEPSIERCLIAMAMDRVRNPSYYEELTRWYGIWGGTHHLDGTKRTRFSVGGPEPRHLLAKHATEEYRLTWESLWLGPPSKDTGLMSRGMGFFRYKEFDFRNPGTPDEIWELRSPGDIRLHALARIGNNESISAILYRTKMGLSRHTVIFSVLGYFCTEEALQGILDCITIWEAVDPEKPVLINKGDILLERTLHEYVLRIFTDPANREESRDEKDRLLRVEKWRDVIERFPKDGLPLDQRELLEQVLAFKRETEEESEAP